MARRNTAEDERVVREMLSLEFKTPVAIIGYADAYRKIWTLANTEDNEFYDDEHSHALEIFRRRRLKPDGWFEVTEDNKHSLTFVEIQKTSPVTLRKLANYNILWQECDSHDVEFRLFVCDSGSAGRFVDLEYVNTSLDLIDIYEEETDTLFEYVPVLPFEEHDGSKCLFWEELKTKAGRVAQRQPQ